MIQRFARPYAKAVLGSAGSLEAATEIQRDLERFAEAMATVPRLGATAANPGVPAAVKQRTVLAVAQALELAMPSQRVLRLLVDRSRLGELPEIVAAVADLIRQKQGVVTAEVTAAAELDAGQREQLRLALEGALGKKVEVNALVDPDLLGGFVALVGSERYDLSLAGQLQRMAQRMASGV